ncbi:MAG: cysteine desulfurase [Kiritimatiellae bacterium]|nr:cysteine desulfurase [Kiritimatiellia bacterium]
MSSVKIPKGLVYLDNNATTACFPEVVAAMAPYWNAAFGNAESAHFAGRLAHRAVESARAAVADALGADPGQIYFNSGATEGNNWIFQAFADSQPAARRIVVSAIEHKSVLNAAKLLEGFGFEVILLPVTPDGVVDIGAAREAIRHGTGLVSVQLANNETGVVQPVRELTALAHEVGAFFHCDAVQALGKMPIDLGGLDVDSAAFSAHKIHGPKGAGFLYLRDGANRFPFPMPLSGGGQERGVRPGTHNVPGIVGLGKAMELLPDASALTRMKAMRDAFENAALTAIPGSRVNGTGAERLPNTTNFFIPGVSSEILLANMPLLCVSTGSACNSGVVDSSYVLKAMSIPKAEAGCSIRISASSLTERRDYDAALQFIVEARLTALEAMQ